MALSSQLGDLREGTTTVTRSDSSRLAPEQAAVRADVAWQRLALWNTIALDLVSVGAAVAVALAIGGNDETSSHAGLHNPAISVGISIVAWPIALALAGAYNRRQLGAGAESYRAVMVGGGLYLACIAVVSVLLHSLLPRLLVLWLLSFTMLFTVATRFAGRQLLHWGRRRGRWLDSTLLVGSLPSTRAVQRHLDRNSWAGLNVADVCDPALEFARSDGSVDVAAVAARAQASGVAAVAVTSDVDPTFLKDLAWELRGKGIDLLVAPALTDVAGPRVVVRRAAGLPLLQVEEPQLSGFARFAKGAFDRSAALLGLLLGAPFFLAIAIVIKCTSRGPVFYRQTRIGRGGRPFEFIKFRTMVDGADAMQSDLADLNEAAGALFKIRSDPRVTRVGHVLRRYSIDELPQLWHVLLGDMSLVGPRPPLPTEVERYDLHEQRRLMVLPGLTGLWQVSGRSDLPWDEAVRLDIYYVQHWSLTMDLVILMKTFTAVVRGSGAY